MKHNATKRSTLLESIGCFCSHNEEVQANQKWRPRFPDVYERLDALIDSTPPEWGKVWIPRPMLVEMTGQTQLVFATNGKWLMSTIDKGGIPVGYEKVSALEALEKYGPERVFEAADKASSRVDDFEGANDSNH
jgi:hypothetical protein